MSTEQEIGKPLPLPYTRPWGIEVRQLHYFVVVAEEGTLRRASERLHISQPPLGRQIQHMEEALGVTLFDRSPKGMVLTPAGHELLSHAYDILERCWIAGEQVAKTASGIVAALTIAFSDDYIFSDLAAAVARYRADHPNVVVSANLAYAHSIVDSLQLGSIHAGLVNSPLRADASGIVTRTLPSTPLYVAVPRAHELAHREEATLQEFKDCTFVVGDIRPYNAMYLYVLDSLRSSGVTPKFVRNIWPKEFQIDLVGQGVGVAIMICPRYRPQRSDVAFVRLSDEGADITPCIVWREDEAHAEYVKEFAEYVAATFDQEDRTAVSSVPPS